MTFEDVTLVPLVLVPLVPPMGYPCHVLVNRLSRIGRQRCTI